MISLAGGLRPEAGPMLRLSRRIEEGEIPLEQAEVVASGNYSVAAIDLTKLLRGEIPEQNIWIRAHDVLSVTEAEIIYVIGNVNKAGGFPLKQGETLSVLHALSLAQGLAPHHSAGKSRIIRFGEGTRERTEIPVDIGRLLSGKDPDINMVPDDILVVPSSTGKKVLSRSLEAAVQLATGVIIWRR
jgi:polysaccharide export outer membrane protein